MSVSKTASTWSKRLDRFDRADVTIAQFCLQEGISQASFYQWRRKLRGQPPAPKSIQTPPMPRFLPVSLPTPPVPPPETLQSLMTVELPGGIRVRFEIPADHAPANRSEDRP